MISSTGFPLCLSGIPLLPQNQRPASLGPESRIRRCSRDGSAAQRSVDLFDSACEDSVLRDDSHSTERSDSESSFSLRHSVAREMADLDNRRDAIRRQMTMMGDDIISLRLRRYLVECIEKQRSFEVDESGTPWKSVAARAA